VTSGALPAIGRTISSFSFPTYIPSCSLNYIFITRTHTIPFRSIMAVPRTSVGQANLRSPLNLRRQVGSSIVQRLATRSVSGRGLGVRVHQHFGFRLHLEWQAEGGRRHCCERFFTYFEDVDSVCQELTRGNAEGLCTCVTQSLFGKDWFCACDDGDCIFHSLVSSFKRKVTVCSLGPVAMSQADLMRRRRRGTSWIKQCQEMEPEKYRCLCSVTNSEWIYSVREWPTEYASLPSSSSSSSS